MGVNFVAVFFAAAIVAGALQRLEGGDPTIGSAVSVAWGRKSQIFGWALLSTVVTLVINAIEERAGVLGRIGGFFLDVAWAVATAFALPVIIVEGTGPVASLKRSGSIVKARWGDAVGTYAGAGVVFLPAMLVLLVVAFLLAAISPVVGIVVAVAGVLVLASLSACVSGIARAALYQYATTGSSPLPDPALAAQAFRPRRRGGIGGFGGYGGGGGFSGRGISALSWPPRRSSCSRSRPRPARARSRSPIRRRPTSAACPTARAARSTSSPTTSRSTTASCGRSASDPRCSSGTRAEPRPTRSTRNGCPSTDPSGSRPRSCGSPPAGRRAELCVTDVAAVAWAATQGTLDFHPWPSRRANTEAPDELRIDLDPQPGTGYAEVVETALALQPLLEELGLVGWPKTSGSKGIHVYVRLEAGRYTFTDCRKAVLAIGRALERRRPDLVTTAWWREERGERVFVDYNRMARDQTIASAYSVRARREATVSAPLRWSEVPDAVIGDFDISTMRHRFAQLGDVHEGIDDAPCQLDAVFALADADERDRGLGDAPYPPNHPKMPGEPLRSRPSVAGPAADKRELADNRRRQRGQQLPPWDGVSHRRRRGNAAGEPADDA